MSADSHAGPANLVVTVRGLTPELKARLRIRAAQNARSMEAEVRAILEVALSAPDEDVTDLATFARSLFAPLGGVTLDLPPRELAREPPGFASREVPASNASTIVSRRQEKANAGQAVRSAMKLKRRRP